MNIEKKEQLEIVINELTKLETTLICAVGEKKAEKVLKELIEVFENNDLARPTALIEDYFNYIKLLFSIDCRFVFYRNGK